MTIARYHRIAGSTGIYSYSPKNGYVQIATANNVHWAKAIVEALNDAQEKKPG